MTRPQRTLNRIGALFLDTAPGDARQTLTALRFSKHETSWAVAMVERWQTLGGEMADALLGGGPTDAGVRRWLAQLGRLHAGAFLRIALARWDALRCVHQRAPDASAVRSLHRRMRASMFGDPIELADLAITGDDLRRMGIPAGPVYAKILHALLEWVLEDPARNTSDALLGEARRTAATLGWKSDGSGSTNE